MAATITNVFIMALLVGSIGYGFMISRRVQRLMSVLTELEPAVREFAAAVDKSEASVTQMSNDLHEGALAAAKTTDERQIAEESNSEPAPTFSSRRYEPQRVTGVRVIQDKQDLVRRFFETSRTETRA